MSKFNINRTKKYDGDTRRKVQSIVVNNWKKHHEVGKITKTLNKAGYATPAGYEIDDDFTKTRIRMAFGSLNTTRVKRKYVRRNGNGRKETTNTKKELKISSLRTAILYDKELTNDKRVEMLRMYEN